MSFNIQLPGGSGYSVTPSGGNITPSVSAQTINVGIGGVFIVSGTEPATRENGTDLKNGDIWLNTTDNSINIYVDGDGFIAAAGQSGPQGPAGDGFTGGSYDAGTGVLTFTSDDGIGFSTGDLRGSDGVDGSDGDPGIQGPPGVAGPQGPQGNPGSTGPQGDGFTGGSYDVGTGVVTFTSDDGLGFSTGDLRGSDGSQGIQGPQGDPGPTGPQGDGFTGGSYDTGTGVVTFTSDDGLGFVTGDLRGADSTVPGPQGDPGPTGPQGDGFTGGSYNALTGVVTFTSDDGLGFATGDLRGADSTVPGPQGDPGNDSTVSVGTTTTGAEGTNASVTNSGTSSAAVLNFTIPRGDTGAQGNPGAAATISVGTTTTGIPGSSASVANSGSSSAATFDFTIPRGDKGDTGDAGAAATISVGTVTTGAAGSSATVTNSGTTSAAVFDFTIPQGQGTATGGTTGQILAKASNTDYDTQWVSTPPADISSSSIDQLSDVDTSTSTPTNGQALVWNSTDGEWQPGTVASSAPVDSVNTQTGAVVLDADDIDDTLTLHKFATAAQLSAADSAVQPGDLATVATSGSYGDLSGTPTIPTNNNQLTNGAGYITGYTVTSGDVTAHEGDLTIAQSQVTNLTTDLGNKADLVAGVVPTSQIPTLAITEYLGSVANQTALLALSGERGDWAIRTDTGSTWVLTTDGGSIITHWTELATPSAPVTSVNSQTGTVVLGASDVGAATTAQGALADSAVQPGDLATVATTGAYGDLTGTPTIPTNNNQLTNGAGYITNITSENLADLSDVTITSVANGDILSYNGTAWVNAAAPPADISGSNISQLNDVTVTSASAGEVLRYNGSNWVDAQLAYSDLSGTPTLGTAAATASTDYATAAQGSTADSAVQPTDSIDVLSDVDTSTVAPTDGQALLWDNTAGKWEPGTVSGSGTDLGVNTTTTTNVVTSSTGNDATLNEASGTAAGLMSVAHHDKLDGIASNATNVTNNNQIANGAGYITDYTVTSGDVTAHQTALSITESQISDLGSYLTSVALNDVTDVTITAAATGEVLRYNGTTWVDATLDYSDLSGTPTIPTNNNQLTNGAGYITSYTVTEGDVTAHQAALSITESQISDLGSYLTSVALNDVSDVTITAAATGEVLRYNGTAWVDAQLAYSDLSGTPTLATVSTSGSYNDLSDLPTLGTAAATASTDYATAAQGTKADNAVQPTDSINVLSDVDTSTVAPTNGQALLWNSTDGEWQPGAVSGSGTDLSYTQSTNELASSTGNNVTLPLAGSALNQDGLMSHEDKSKLNGIASGAEVNVNADWNASTGDAQILNKPTLGTAAATDSTDYATAAQGALADSALQSVALNDVTDVAITAAATGEVLRYNGSNWVDAQLAYSDLSGLPTLGTAASTASTDYATAAQGTTADSAVQPTDSIDALSDVDTTTAAPSTGQVLEWDGSNWVPSTPAAGGAVPTSDTAPSSPGDGDLWYDTASAQLYIYYADGTSNQWVSTFTAGTQAGGISDGDKGDISVSNSGSTWTIDNNAITSAKINTGAVQTGNIGSNAVTTDKINNNAVTAAKLADTAVTAGSYTAADITVDAQGRITAASNGSGGGGIQVASYDDTTGGQSVDSATATRLTGITNVVVEDSIYSNSAGVITISSAGVYEIHCSVGVTGTTGNYRYTAQLDCEVNGSVVASQSGSYIRANTGSNNSYIDMTTIQSVTAGQTVDFTIRRISSTSGNGTTTSSGSRILIKKLS